MSGPSEKTSYRGPDRRSTRSDDPLVALGRLLDGVRRHSGIEALAVADPTGLLIAGAGAFRACEELAATAPFADGAAANDTVPSRIDIISRDTEVRSLTIDGVEVFLVARDPAGSGLDAAESGCRRILGKRHRD